MRHAALVLGSRLLFVFEEVIVFVYLKHRRLSLNLGELGWVPHGSLVLNTLVCRRKWFVAYLQILHPSPLRQLFFNLLIQQVHSL